MVIYSKSFIQTACVLITLIVEASNGFVLHKKLQDKDSLKEDITRPKRDGDLLNDSGALSSSGSSSASSDSISIHGVGDVGVVDLDPECVPISEVETDQYGLPVGQPLNSTEMSNITDTRSQRYRHQRYHNYDSSTRQCPTSLLDTNGHHRVNRNSLCPWTYVADVDADRFPREMMFAECHCPYCINPDTSEYSQTSGSSCKPVFHKVRVLRRCEGLCVDGVCRYKPDYEFVPVACTCVRPRTE